MKYRTRTGPASAEHTAEAAPPDWLRRCEAPLALALSAVLVWIAQFHHFRDFGLYADDYALISTAMGKQLDFLLGSWSYDLMFLPLGRPVAFFFLTLFSFVGDKLGSLPAIYLVGLAVVTLNTFLCYRLLRVRLPAPAAAVGAAVFCLFPADTTKILLHATFSLQPSLTLALLAALAYAAGRGLLSYLLAAGALLCYESAYLALFALPLFMRPWDRSTPRELARHAAALMAVVIVDVLLRLRVGEGRAAAAASDLTAIVPEFFGSLVLGPAHSLSAMFSGPLIAIPTWDTETRIVALLSLLGSGVVLVLARHGIPVVPRREILQVGAAGLAMLVLGYGLAFFHYPPNEVVGRASSVHLGATLGMAVIAATGACLLLAMSPRVATVLIACYLAIIAGYYNTIAGDFVLSWQVQRTFWRQVVDCCSDLQDGTILLYELTPPDCGGYQMPSGDRCKPNFITSHEWSDPLVLDQTFVFPADWSKPPRLFDLTNWVDRVHPQGDQLIWLVPPGPLGRDGTTQEHWEVLPQDNVILLRRASDGSLTRISGTRDVAGQTLRLKTPTAATVAWPAGQLSALLLGSY